ncbi:hypothetical protein VCHENC02_3669B, partial [Vibrio harveyi]
QKLWSQFLAPDLP